MTLGCARCEVQFSTGPPPRRKYYSYRDRYGGVVRRKYHHVPKVYLDGVPTPFCEACAAKLREAPLRCAVCSAWAFDRNSDERTALDDGKSYHLCGACVAQIDDARQHRELESRLETNYNSYLRKLRPGEVLPVVRVDFAFGAKMKNIVNATNPWDLHAGLCYKASGRDDE